MSIVTLPLRPSMIRWMVGSGLRGGMKSITATDPSGVWNTVSSTRVSGS